MSEKYPTDAAWWEATLFRLSGPENVLIRRLIAGNSDLPPAAFEVLVRDDDWEVLRELAFNPLAPREVELAAWRHPDALDFADDEFYERISTHPDLTPQDLERIMESDVAEAQEQAVLHPNGTAGTVNAFRREYVGDFDGFLIGRLLERFPYAEHQRLWEGMAEDIPQTLLECDALPFALLRFIAEAQWQKLMCSSEDYSHELTEAIFGHPQANGEIFERLLDTDEKLLEQDCKWDFPCLQVIAESKTVPEKWKAFALERIEGKKDAEDGKT